MKNSPEPKLPAALLQNGIHQIALVVEDLDKTVEHYWHSFGIGPWHFYTYERPLLKMSRYHGKDVDNAIRIALSYFGSTRIELIEVLRGETIQTDFVDEHGYGIQHLGIYVEDIQAAIAEAQEAGFTVIQEGSGFGPDGDGHYAYLDTEKAFGATYELIQRPKRRHPPDKIYPPED
jgi:catechol 2,3-dioxygenase-like lactoylglutathione lyase family enzyme